MKLNQADIGGEIISILTKGMYTDPKDALREYVQNGVDADANKIFIKIRQNNIVVEDDGHGMDKVIMRKAVRVGISEKNPKKSVGFMGIGIYSSFHLCDTLTIYSRVENQGPNMLVFDFKKMREILEIQKEERFNDRNKDKQQVALLKLLEKHIQFIALDVDEFPIVGTRVEMVGLEPSFFMGLSKFEEVSEYLEKVIPLPFDPEFRFGILIQNHIDTICKKYKAAFKLIELHLQVNDYEKQLYKPYKDSDFIPSPLEPKFYNLENDDGFLGISWGCLNKGKEIIKNEKVRGFIIRKQGFAIGTRAKLLPIFGAKFFYRYVGEVIVLHSRLMPNASRSDFEYSNLRTSFYSVLEDIVQKYNEYANRYQEQEKAEQELDKAISKYKEIKSQLEFFQNNSDKLLEFHRTLYKYRSDIEKREKSNWKYKKSRKNDVANIKKLIGHLLLEIHNLIRMKRKSQRKLREDSESLFLDLEKAPRVRQKDYEEPEPKNLIEVIELIGIQFDDEMRSIFELIDEQFIQTSAKNRDDYTQKLIKLKNDIEDLLLNE